MRKTADKYGLALLLHEKPFAGINGSASTTTGRWRPTPARTCSTPATIRTTTRSSWCSARRHPRGRKYSELLRVSIASAAQRSPPGRQRSAAGDHLDLPGRSAQRHHRADRKRRRQEQQAGRPVRDRRVGAAEAAQGRGRSQSHQRRSPSPATSSSSARSARRRTSPGPTRCSTRSSPSRWIHRDASWRTRPRAGRTSTAIQDLLPGSSRRASGSSSTATTTPKSGTSEAEKRGLPNLKNTVDVLPVITRKDDRACSPSTRCTASASCTAGCNILSENYVKTVNIEAQLMLMMAKTMILPAAIRYQGEVAQAVNGDQGGRRGRGREAGGAQERQRRDQRFPERSSRLWRRRCRTMPKAMRTHMPSTFRARAAGDGDLRKAGDKLETIVADDLWPLPTYREMLFISRRSRFSSGSKWISMCGSLFLSRVKYGKELRQDYG
jgi:glutamine synthetase